MESKKRYFWLDWMRFIAALMVVLCHSRGYNWIEWGSLSKADHTLLIKLFFVGTRAGLEWVIVFFVLSGFLVGGSVIRRCLNGTFDIRLFAIDRLTRIWVPLIPALILTFGIALYCGIPASLLDFSGNLLALQGVFFKNFGHNEPLWSLSYEVWFYVLIGSVAVIINCSNKSQIFGFLVFLFCCAIFSKLNSKFLACWMLGVFSYFLVFEEINPLLIISALMTALLGIGLSQLQSETLSVSKNFLPHYLPDKNISCLIESAGIALLIASICRVAPDHPWLIRFERKGAAFAAFSYTLYLTHYPILVLWEHFLPQRSLNFSLISFVFFIAKVCSSLFFAWLLYLPFEAKTPILRAVLRKQSAR